MPRHLIQITDTHLFAEPHARHRGWDTEASLLRVIARAREERCDLVLVTGDLVHDGSSAGYVRLARHLDALEAPALCIPGNHDEPAVLRAALPAGRCQWPRIHHAAPWTLLLLDSHLPGEVAGQLGDDELDRLARSLGAGDGPVLIALHHPPVAVGSVWIDGDGLRDAEAFWSVVERHPRVKGVVWGHIHQAYDSTRGDVRLLATPSTGLQFTPGRDELVIDTRSPGYRRLVLHDDGRMETTVVRVA